MNIKEYLSKDIENCAKEIARNKLARSVFKQKDWGNLKQSMGSNDEEKEQKMYLQTIETNKK